MYIYIIGYIYMATYSYIYPYMLYICTLEVYTIASKHTNIQEAGASYTKLTQLWCSTTQFPHGELQKQSSYPCHMVTR